MRGGQNNLELAGRGRILKLFARAPLALLAIHCGLLAWSASLHSPTLNEPGHLAAGIRIWQSGQFDVYRVNPPLVKLVAAVPVLLTRPITSWNHLDEQASTRPEFELGENFVAANGEHSFFLFTIARWACIPFSLLGGYVSCRWARDLYGPQAGLLATTLWCFCPNVIAHGQLITPDVAATSLGMAACYMFWRWLKQPNWHQALVSGAVLGIAELAKTTLLLLFVLWPILWVACRRPRRCAMGGAGWSQELGMLAVSLAVAMYILNLGYGFEGTGARLGDFQFLSATLGARPGEDRPPSSGGNRFAGSWMGALPMPLPKNYVSGVDLQKRDCEGVYQLSYLRGETQRGGWPYYYLYAVAIKTPLGTWLLILMAIGLRWLHGPGVSRCDEIMLLAPAAVIFGFVSSQTGLNQHMRYVLPAVPFVYVWTSRIAQSFSHNRFTTVAAIGALAYSTTSGALVYPHSLSYFNELVGGPLRGPEHLIYSNIDWGQDLLYLKQWLGKHPEARPLKLAYFGRFDPIYAGIEYTAPECIPADANLVIKPIPPGWYAISVNFVRGFPHFTYSGYGTKINVPRNALTAFQQQDPVAKAGYSIYIYHVPTERCSSTPMAQRSFSNECRLSLAAQTASQPLTPHASKSHRRN